MSFFESRPDRRTRPREVWAPPDDILPAVVGLGTILHRSRDLAVVLDRVQVYPEGCRWWVMFAVRHAAHQVEHATLADPDDYGGVSVNLPDELVRFGVRYPDGTIATTVDPVSGGSAGGEVQQYSRTGPFLVLRFDGATGYGQHSEGWYELLLWPLPPATTVELVTEWPARGVLLTRVEVDGAMINNVATRAQPLWLA